MGAHFEALTEGDSWNPWIPGTLKLDTILFLSGGYKGGKGKIHFAPSFPTIKCREGDSGGWAVLK